MDTPTLPAGVGVVGLGLIGASLCAALRKRLPTVRLVGLSRGPRTAGRALADGLCDQAGTGPELLASCELIVLCIPVDAMPDWMSACAAHAPGALVTDAGSTKAWVCARAAERLPAGSFCGGHPMAGSERSGYDAADPELFAGSTWVLTPDSPEVLARFAGWRAAVEALGARVDVIAAADHDAACALISHMPFALSAALMRSASTDPAWSRASLLAATGFRDMVRIAGGDPAMYGAIVATNRDRIIAALDALEAELGRLRRAVDGGDDLLDYFAGAREARLDWLETRRLAGRPVAR